MKKRNAYAAMVFSFISGMAFFSQVDNSILIGSIALVIAYLVSINYGLDVEEGEENEQTYGIVNRTGTRSEEKGA